MARSMRDRARIGLIGLNAHTAGGIAAAPARELRDELEGALLGPKVRQRQAGVRIDDRGELDPGEVVPLGDHLRPEQHRPAGVGEAPE